LFELLAIQVYFVKWLVGKAQLWINNVEILEDLVLSGLISIRLIVTDFSCQAESNPWQEETV
jgi:hypothetical protein